MAVDEAYARFRTLHRSELRTREVPRYAALAPQERLKQVGLVRAVGAVFGEHGTPEEKAWARAWMLELLGDAQEKIRRYAVQALPKLDSGPEEESALLGLRTRAAGVREREAVDAALEKIGGTAALEALGGAAPAARLLANAARRGDPGRIVFDRPLLPLPGLRLHLRGRHGLEHWIRQEWEQHPHLSTMFRLIECKPGLVALRPLAGFTLGDVFSLRCFGSLGLSVGLVKLAAGAEQMDALARLLASSASQRILAAFQDGPPRYRLEWVGRKTAEPLLRQITGKAFQLCPSILNDSRQAPWSAEIHPAPGGSSLEWRPRLVPDPRFSYRVGDVPAASHPPLAAALAFWAGREGTQEHIWDPFCGSGLELIESARRGQVAQLYGTDLDPVALEACRANFAAAGLSGLPLGLAACDFRSGAAQTGIRPGSLTLVISNPPLGRRVRIDGLRSLIADLFAVAATALRPGGRLILANPVRMDSPHPALRLEEQRTADLGGFDCRLEKWRKV